MTPNDIAQGSIGNCWIMVALSALAEYPERIENIFHNREISQAGFYAVNIYALGVPYTTYIDDQLPHRYDGQLLFANVGSDDSIWGPLLEKTIAKYTGNYWHLHKGLNPDGIGFFNGSPDYSFEHWQEL